MKEDTYYIPTLYKCRCGAIFEEHQIVKISVHGKVWKHCPVCNSIFIEKTNDTENERCGNKSKE